MVLLRMVGPTVICVVDHKPGLTAINADVITGNETGLVRGQKQNHIGNIQGASDPSRRLLKRVGTLVDGVCGVDPAGGRWS